MIGFADFWRASRGGADGFTRFVLREQNGTVQEAKRGTSVD
jgi:hypothetical protein